MLLMELAYVNLHSTETDAQVNLEHWGINICFISALTFFIYIFFIAGCHYFFTCSDHGSCRNDGTCQCDEGFYNDSCSSKHDKLLLQQVTAWCCHSVVCQISWFCWTKHGWIRVEKNSTNIAKIYRKNKNYLLNFLFSQAVLKVMKTK